MLIEAVNQAERAVKDMLTVANRDAHRPPVSKALHRLVEAMLTVADRGTAAASTFCLGLKRSKGIASKLSAFQTAAASCAAATERHGDGGTQIHADTRATRCRKVMREGLKAIHSDPRRHARDTMGWGAPSGPRRRRRSDPRRHGQAHAQRHPRAGQNRASASAVDTRPFPLYSNIYQGGKRDVIPIWKDLVMLNEAIDQAERAVEDMLSAGDRGTAAASNFRLGLKRSKSIASKLSAFQTAAASCAAATERHGDGGAQIHADTAGPTRNDARGRVKTGPQPVQSVLGPSRYTPIYIKEEKLMSYLCGRISSC